jgi:dGTPase
MKNKFINEAISPTNIKWENCIQREASLYGRNNQLRSEFYRDYTRILHSTSYRRLKHKTQVFFAPENDHICTRIEHVNHVASVSYTIGLNLGLNVELITAIANGHDLGHTPFGHLGEVVIKDLMKEEKMAENFWHEKNSLWFVDKIELLPAPDGNLHNLNLTYAVRDGIVCHCGEVDENGLKPRDNQIDLEKISNPGEIQPYTWEACVVKISDKIAYLGRDIEDALRLGIIDAEDLNVLKNKLGMEIKTTEINNTIIMNDFIVDICENSNPQDGIFLSAKNFDKMKTIKEFNYKYIYENEKLAVFKNYAGLVISSIYRKLSGPYDQKNLAANLASEAAYYPRLIKHFEKWLVKYSDYNIEKRVQKKYANVVVYKISDKADYQKAILDFISGMTDNFILDLFGEVTSFR